jgi:glutathione S-transferase
MSLTFYCAPMSSAVVTEMVLEELGVPYERVTLDIQKGDTKKPEFLAVNPNGKVPCIVHDGTAIWESVALTIYLGETFGVERSLFPAPGPRRGEAMKWIVWNNVTLGDALGRFTRNNTNWFPDDQKNAKAGEVARQDIAECLRILDVSLAGKQYLAGDYTLADTHLAVFLAWLRHLKIDFTPFANVEAWSERCRARPVYQKVMAGFDAG